VFSRPNQQQSLRPGTAKAPGCLLTARIRTSFDVFRFALELMVNSQGNLKGPTLFSKIESLGPARLEHRRLPGTIRSHGPKSRGYSASATPCCVASFPSRRQLCGPPRQLGWEKVSSAPGVSSGSSPELPQGPKTPLESRSWAAQRALNLIEEAT